MKNIIIAALTSAALLPSAAVASNLEGTPKDFQHPWGYDGMVIERGLYDYDTFAFIGPKGLEIVDVNCNLKEWYSRGYNSEISGFHDAVLTQWCGKN